jgi:hypothetical protein
MKNPSQESQSDEYINSLVDGELATDEREQAYRRIEEDAVFKARACETRTLKEMVKGAYSDLPPAPSLPTSLRSVNFGWWPQAVAAVLMLALGLGGGWVTRGKLDKAPQVERIAGLPAGYQQVSFATRVDPSKVILHLDSDEPAHLEAALDLTERLLAQRTADGRVELVANGSGLALLRQDISPYRERIARLADQHSNLTFVACGQTVARLKREGVHVDLVPEAHVVSTSAVSEILHRLRDGWVYVEV